MSKYDAMMSQTKLPEDNGGDYWNPPVGKHVVEIVGVVEDVYQPDGKPPVDFHNFTLKMLAPEFQGKTFTRPFFLYPDNLQRSLEYLGKALFVCGIWNEGQPLSSATIMYPSLRGKRLEVAVVKRKDDPTKVNIFFNRLVTPNASPQQQPQQQARQADEYATDPSGFGAGSEDLPF